MKKRLCIILSLLALIVLIPILLRKESATASPDSAQDRLVILTPHNESIRREFGEAFASFWKRKTGRSLYVDWRTPGGTSEISMVIDAGFQAAEETGNPGIGVDLFFGGGEPDFEGQARKGRFLPLEIFRQHPELFGDQAVIPETFTGERYFAKNHTWVATCMSQFGICYNPDVLARLKLPPPKQWRDLADPRYAGQLSLADPTKSGSVARTFELILQSEMQREISARGDTPEARAAGWAAGFQLIQSLAANARYFTDSASKIPHDVSMGDAAAGMCIDFYGRSYSDLTARDGSPRLIWTAPLGGTTLSGDPIAVLKGARHPEIAQAFVSFTLSPEGQALWFRKTGKSGKDSLHRLPIRRDLYTPEFLENSSMPTVNPYADAGNFTYRKDLTGGAFNTIRQLIKIACIDSHEEMKTSWAALKDAGMPPAAVAEFLDSEEIPYSGFGGGHPILDGRDSLKAAEYATALGGQFRAHYREARMLAK
ncbi:MAG: extracellular solute-binding protein [Luteolibacter sp.]